MGKRNRKNNQMKNKLLYLVIATIFILSPLSIKADGGVIRPMPDGDFAWVDENSQQAFINYEEGIEKLIIAVDIEEEDSEMAWILPIPGKSEEIEIDITSELPIFYGDDVVSKAKVNFNEKIATSYLASTFGQIWTLPFSILFVSLGSGSGGNRETTLSDMITISSHIEKAGMVAEVITAKNEQAIYNYFSEKGFNIKQGSIPELSFYIEKDYSFVVSWIAPEIANKKNKGERGIFINFPVSKIYYPLVLTSAYGEAKIPITIRVLDHVKPEIFSEIKPYTKISYFTERTVLGGRRSNEARCISDIFQIRTEMQIYHDNSGHYPSSLEDLLLENKSMRMLIEDIDSVCNSQPLYSSKGSDDYKMKFLLRRGMWEINSSLFSGYIDYTDEKLVSPELLKFYGSKKPWAGKAEYTKISINAPAKLFKKDLWMEKGAPLKISFYLWTINNSWIVLLVLYLLITGAFSFISGGLAGLICFHKFKKYALIGLGNIASLIGLILVLNYIKRKYKEDDRYSKISFPFLFSIIFISLLIILPTVMISWITGINNIFTIPLIGIIISWIIIFLTIFLLNKINLKNKIVRAIFAIILFVILWVIFLFLSLSFL